MTGFFVPWPSQNSVPEGCDCRVPEPIGRGIYRALPSAEPWHQVGMVIGVLIEIVIGHYKAVVTSFVRCGGCLISVLVK